jgi:uncharacterized Zn finger protein (UPF0148 family)
MRKANTKGLLRGIRCPDCGGPLVHGEGCICCPICGFTRC